MKLMTFDKVKSESDNQNNHIIAVHLSAASALPMVKAAKADNETKSDVIMDKSKK